MTRLTPADLRFLCGLLAAAALAVGIAAANKPALAIPALMLLVVAGVCDVAAAIKEKTL